MTEEEREEQERFHAEHPNWPRDEVVGGVNLTMCHFCADIAGDPFDKLMEHAFGGGADALSPLLEKCVEIEGCPNWKKKETD